MSWVRGWWEVKGTVPPECKELKVFLLYMCPVNGVYWHTVDDFRKTKFWTGIPRNFVKIGEVVQFAYGRIEKPIEKAFSFPFTVFLVLVQPSDYRGIHIARVALPVVYQCSGLAIWPTCYRGGGGIWYFPMAITACLHVCQITNGFWPHYVHVGLAHPPYLGSSRKITVGGKSARK